MADRNKKPVGDIYADKEQYQKLFNQFGNHWLVELNKKLEYYNSKPFQTPTKQIQLKKIGQAIILINPNVKSKTKLDEGFIKKEIEKNPNAEQQAMVKKMTRTQAERKALEMAEYNDEEIKDIMSDIDNFLVYKEDKDGNEIPIKVNVDRVVDYLLQEFDFKTIYNSNSEVVWFYEKGIWNRKGKEKIKTEVEKLLEGWCKNNVVLEVFEKIKRKTAIDKEEFETIDINHIPLENGIYDIDEKKLVEHSPEFYFKTLIPIQYNKKSKCPTFLKFISESLYPEDVPVIQEWFGFQLYRRYLIKKGVICLGDTDTGKTVLLNSLINFIGDKNKCGLSLQLLTAGTDFNKLNLKGMYSNIYDDLSSKDLNDGGSFKVATGGGWISGEEKFGDHTQFKSFAKQTFATNKIPPVKDNDDMAYFSRWIVLRFDNPPEKKDLRLQDKIKDEMSGVFNWALDGLYRLLERGEFSYNKSPEEVKKIMEMSGDPLIKFGEECLIQSEESITKDEMYQIYCKWASEKDEPLLSKEQLGRRLNQKIKYLIPKIVSGKRLWANVSLKSYLKGKYNTIYTFKKYIYNIEKGNKNSNTNICNNIKKSVESVTENTTNLTNNCQNCQKELLPSENNLCYSCNQEDSYV